MEARTFIILRPTRRGISRRRFLSTLSAAVILPMFSQRHVRISHSNPGRRIAIMERRIVEANDRRLRPRHHRSRKPDFRSSR